MLGFMPDLSAKHNKIPLPNTPKTYLQFPKVEESQEKSTKST